MLFRNVFRLGLLLLLFTCLAPGSAAAQQPRRWLADPALMPHGGGFDGPSMNLVDQRSGWATSGSAIYRFDGRYWRTEQRFNLDIAFFALDMASPTYGWAGGASIFRTSAVMHFARYDGKAWNIVTDIVNKDGQASSMSGVVFDIESFPDGTALALAYSYPRTVVLRFDGSVWRDQTPDEWAPGVITRLSMTSPTEGWAAGAFDIPNTNRRRPAIFHYQNGQWTEMSLPTFEAESALAITMRGGEGWVVFSDLANAEGECDTSQVLRYTNGAWTLIPTTNHNNQPITAFELIPGTNRGWASLAECTPRQFNPTTHRARFDNGAFTIDTEGAQIVPRAYGLLNDDVQYALAGTYFLRYSDETLPTAPAPQRNAGNNRYFAETKHNVSDRFLSYYQTHGLNLGEPGVSSRESLALFGYPLSEPFVELNPDTEELLEVQYFERARMEFHPRNREPYTVLLGRLTVPALRSRGLMEFPPLDPPTANCNRYTETGFDLCPPFREFWQSNDGLMAFGFPITLARDEQSRTDGKTYRTQYFERERLEYHPELKGTPYEILLGLLGTEELQTRGYLP